MDFPLPHHVAELLVRVREICAADGAAERMRRRSAWANRMEDLLRSAPGKVFRWCRGEAACILNCLARPDSSLTGNAAEMDALLREAWRPIFCMYADTPQPE